MPKPSRLGIVIKRDTDNSEAALDNATVDDATESKKRKAAMTEEEIARKKKLKQLMQSEICDDERDSLSGYSFYICLRYTYFS
jgi:hypothetical protein